MIHVHCKLMIKDIKSYQTYCQHQKCNSISKLKCIFARFDNLRKMAEELQVWLPHLQMI